jgi:tRNA-dihydrouridine synthase
MIARGSLGYPWIFEELTANRAEPPGREDMVSELLWVIDQAGPHFGADRAARYLRKFYPWYLERLDAPRDVSEELQRSADLDRARELVASLAEPAPVGT